MKSVKDIAESILDSLGAVGYVTDNPVRLVQKAIKEAKINALEEAAKIADKWGKCNCQDYYTAINKHEPNAAHLDCEDIAEEIRAKAKELE